MPPYDFFWNSPCLKFDMAQLIGLSVKAVEQTCHGILYMQACAHSTDVSNMKRNQSILVIIGVLSVLILGLNLPTFLRYHSTPQRLVNTWSTWVEDNTSGVPGNHRSGTPNDTLLTLFTSFKNSSNRIFIQSNTVRNWALLKPQVQPVLFTTFEHGYLVDLARQHGWDVHPVPRVKKHGTPHVKDMFFKAMMLYDSTFYGMSNGDILFTDGIIDTLQAAKRKQGTLKSTLVIGMRKNYHLNLANANPIYSKEDVGVYARKGYLFRHDAEDYFLMTPGYPWNKVPDIVIGRPAYDNFLVGLAIKQNVSVIDATNTITALHLQSTNETAKYAGSKNIDGGYNKKVIGHFNYNTGLTSSAQYTTDRSFDREVFFKLRPRRRKKPPVPKVVAKPSTKKSTNRVQTNSTSFT